jgi:hypothetical protein
MSRKILFAGAAAAILSAVALPAFAGTETIGLNQWYTASFGESFPSPVIGGVFQVGTHPNAIATTVGSTDWSIDLTGPAPLTVVDMETSGDQFQVLDNGVVLGLTSTPIDGDTSAGACISCALADSNYSRGIFFLGAGVNDITINYVGVIGDGDVSFLVGTSSVPEPATWALMLAGFGGLGAALRSRRKALCAPA